MHPDLVAELELLRAVTADRMAEHASARRDLITALDARAVAAVRREREWRPPLPAPRWEHRYDPRPPARPAVSVCAAEDDVRGRGFLRRRVRIGRSAAETRKLARWVEDADGESHKWFRGEEPCYWVVRGRWEPARWLLGLLVLLVLAGVAGATVAVAWVLQHLVTALMVAAVAVAGMRWAARKVVRVRSPF